MKRYLSYHSGPYGYGWVKKSNAIPLVTGTQVHAALEGILRLVQAGAPVENKTFRPVINKVVEDYKALVRDTGFEGLDSVESAIILNEQFTLVEGLAWGWIKVMLPIILKEFDIVSIEEEEIFPATDRIHQMSRPDILLRRKADGKVGVHDYKTCSNVTDAMIKEYQSSVQMMVGTIGAAQRLKEPINHYYIHAIQKGGRGEFNKGSGFKQQYSHLCYAKVYPAAPPLQPDTTFINKGFWSEKTPLWEVSFPQKPADVSNMEFYVSQLAPTILNEMFTLIGPYEVLPHMIEQYMRSMPAEEERWIEKLDILYKSPDLWGTEEFQTLLDKTVPRSYACFKWNSKCSQWDICFRQPGWDDPVGTGKFAHRRPHHTPELKQLIDRGIPVPNEVGEEE